MSASNKRPVAGSRSPARSTTDSDATRRIRMGLLGSTALIAAGLACSPAFAQSTPAGGGTITYNNGSVSSGAPGASDGVSITGGSANQSTINNVSLLNTTSVPTADAVRLQATSGVTLTGLNSLRTTVSGGSGLYVQSDANLGVNLSGSSNTFQGSYGIRALAAGGFINFNSTGQTQTITANGTALIGIDVQALLHPEVYFGTSVVSGFATGVQLTQSQASGGYVLFSSTGGSINATGTGIRADAINGAANVTSQTAITAPTGINATGGSFSVTTSGGGAVNSTVAGTGTGILATTTGGDGTINVGAAIGNVTAVNVGVNAQATGTGVLNITTSAAINASGASSRGIFANTDGGGITVVSGGTITAQDTGLYLNAGGTGVVNATVNAAINAFGVGGVGVSSLNALASVFDVNANITGGNRAMAVRGTVNVASAVILTGNFFGIDLSAGGTLNNAGAINSNYRTVAILGGTINNLATGAITSSGTASPNGGAVYGHGTLNNAGAITGNTTDGVFQIGSGTINNTAGGTIAGVRGVFASTTGNVTINNTAGTISGSQDAVNIAGGGRLILANTGTIQATGGGAAGVYINSANATAHSITNSGSIMGGSHATLGYGVSIESGPLTLVNQSGGVIGGTAGGVRMTMAEAATLTLNAGSTVNGHILSEGSGARTLGVAGLLNGAYVASGGSGVDTITLASTGSITGAVSLAAGDDVFNWQGGTLSGTVDGGSGNNTFNAALGVGNSASRAANATTGFSLRDLQSGTLTLTGASASSGQGWTVRNGATLNFDTSAFNVAGGSYAVHTYGGTVNVLAGATVSGSNNFATIMPGASPVTLSNAGTISVDGNIIISNGARLDVTNSGTMTSASYGPVTFSTGGGTLTNTGIITGGSFIAVNLGTAVVATNGVTINNNGSGIIQTSTGGPYAIKLDVGNTVNNAAAAIIRQVGATRGAAISANGSVTVGNLGLISSASTYEAAITSGGVLTLTNSGSIGGAFRGVGTTGAVASSITNNAGGVIAGVTNGINSSAGTTNVTNAGTIGTGTVSGGVFTAGGDGNGISLVAGTITNSGLIDAAAGGVVSTGALTLVNTGTITSRATGTGTRDGVTAGGVATILNAGTITAGQYYGIYTSAGGVVTNAAAGQLAGATAAAVGLDGGGTFNNYGSTTSGSGYGVAAGNVAVAVNLFAGSSTGNIATGSGNDSLALYNGTGTAFAGLLDGGTGIVLQAGSTHAAATVGTVNLGGGTDTLQLRGAGDGTAANGAAGSLNLGGNPISTAEVLTKLDTGTWTLTGAAGVPGITINAGTGAPAGTLIFSGTGLTGAINVNGATVRATTTTAFGTGTLHMIDPTIEFAAGGTYANDISLEVVNGQQSIDPTILRNTSGATVTLSGRIYETFGVGGANQYVTFDGPARTILTNTGNVWGGVTAITSGATLQGATNTISGGSIANAGALVFAQGVDGTFAGNISGAGTLQINSASQAVTLSGVNTFSGATTITAGTLVASGGAAIGDLSAVTIASGATLQLANNETIGSLAGGGTARVLGSTLTLGGDNTSTTFSGSITDQTPVAYVGSWIVSDGAGWATNPPTYTGQEAAALLFGGAAANYRLSTAGVGTGTISDTAWYNRYGGNPNYVEAAANYRVDTGGAGYNAQQDTSAYVQDHVDPSKINYAFTGGVVMGGGLTKTGTGTLTLSGTNNYTGVTSITGGTLVVQNGSAISNLSVVNILSPGAFTVTNSETVASLTGTGATTIASGQTLTLANGSGTYTGGITGGSLVLSGGSWTYGGTRSGGQSSALTMNGANTTLNIANGGSILGGQYLGVRISNAGATVTNLGLIQNAGTGGDSTIGAGLFVQHGSGGTTTVNNGSVTDTGAGSTIQGRNAGVRHDFGSNDLLVINNYGLIVGDLYNGIENTAGGLTVNNFAGGYIATTLGNGISSNSGSAVSVTNAGVIGRNIAGNVTVNGYGVTTNGVLTLNNQAGGTVIGALGGVLTGAASASITNTGAIYGVDGSAISLALGGTVVNGGSGLTAGQNTASLIDSGGASAIAVTNGAFSLQNYGRIIAAGSGVVVGTGGAYTGAVTITNAGLIQGSSNDGISLTGAATVNNLSGGTITGSVAGIRLNGAYGYTLNLAAGSTVNGMIDATASSGANTAVLGGTLNGAYSGGSGVDTFTLGATGSMTSATLGVGADSFIYQGGAFSGVINAGSGVDSFTSALGAGSASVNLTNLVDFETFAHQSGTLTLTGTRGFSGGASVTGGTLVVNGTLQTFASVASGATLSGGGTITSAVTVANGGILANTQGSTLTTGALTLSSGSVINATFSGAGGSALFAVDGALTLDGTVNIASTGAFGMGVYGLMTYTGALDDQGLLLGTTPGGAQRVAVQTSVAGQVNIVHAPTELLFWDGGPGGHDNGAVNGGAGAWTATGSEWTDATGLSNGAMEPQPGFAIFQGTGGVVTVDDSAGAISVTGMQFATDGYRIQGDSITLANASTTIRVGDGTAPSAAWTATIASALTGTGGLLKTDLGTLILGGENNYTGGTIINAGTLQIGEGGAAGSVDGSLVLANGSTLVFARNDGYDFANAVSGAGSVRVNGVVTLSGAITASNGVNVGAGSTVTLSNVDVTTGTAVTAGLNSTVNVASGGLIRSHNGTGVFVSAANGTVNNAGAIAGTTNAVYSSGSLTLTNAATGAVSGAFAIGALQNLNLTNAGSINASVTNFNSSGIYAGGTGVISNTGTITSGTNAIYTQGAGSLTNSGFILGGGAAATIRLFGANSSVTNLAGGEISTTGTGAGLYLDGLGATVVNSGTIRGGNAVNLISGGGAITNDGDLIGTTGSGIVANGGTVIANLAGGSITGATNGVNVVTGSGSLTNGGAITGTSGQGVLLQAGGTITNTGSITGGQSGVRSLNALTLSSAGAISGSVNAIQTVGVFNDSLTFLAGSATTGAVLTDGGDDLVSLAGALNGALDVGDGADTVTLFDTASFNATLDGGNGVDAFVLGGSGAGSLNVGAVLNFESRAMNGAGVWTLSGFDNSTAAWAINSGTLAVGGHQAINDAVAVTIAGPGTLQLNDGEQIGSLNGSGAVALGGNLLVIGGGGSSTWAGVIGGTGDLQIAGGSTLTLTGLNTYSGATYITAGTLRLGASDALSNDSGILLGSGSFLDLQGFSDTVAFASLEGVVNGTGTLTAASYGLDGATINANLGLGSLYQSGGVSIMNGTVNAGVVTVGGGTLTWGGSDRLSDSAALAVGAGATLDLGAFNDTVGTAYLGGTVAGTGTLTATQYVLDGATVNAELGAGALYNSGDSTLNGASGAGTISVQGGTLTLGGSDRLLDTAAVTVTGGASVLNIGAFNDTVGSLTLWSGSTLAGSGTLTAAQYQLTNGIVNANLGAGALYNMGGVSTLNGVIGASTVGVLGGTLNLGASNRLADNAIVSVTSGATLNLGAFSDTVNLALLNGTLAGTGTLTAARYDLVGAIINANLGGGDLHHVNGVSTLNGTSGAANVVVHAGTLTLGASNRLADNATVSVLTGGMLNIGAFNETVGLALLNGTMAGTGTLTAAEYDLNGGVINTNLGGGNLFNVGGASLLMGTSGAANVVVQAGTLYLGASNRLADTATVSVASGSSLNIGAFNDTVGLAVVNGTLGGTGTLTAAQYQLNAATVNANLGAGTLFNLGGVSTLNGTAAASQVQINAGTLRLGASERLSDTATVQVASGATFNVNGAIERIGALFGTGNVDVGSGRLTFGGVESGFGGRLSGSGQLVHTGGLFTLLGDHTIGSISNTGGELRFAGTTTGGLSASGGSVTGAGTIGGALTASNGAVLSPGLAGVQNGIGGFTAGGLTLNGGTLAIDVLGRSGGNLIDQLRINGAANLTGGLLAPTFQGATSNFDFSTRYLFLQANNLVGTFANGSTFTAASQEGLYWRVRYDLAPNAAVLELRQLTSFDPGVSGTGNQRGVGRALAGGQLGASDDWAAVISLIAGLSAAERAAALDSISGEPLADVTTTMFSANDTFLTAMRDGGLGGRKDGGEALNFVDSLSFIGGRENSADRLGDVLNAYDPSASTDRGSGGWVSAYAGDQTLEGKPGQATVESNLNGFAGGYGVRNGSLSLGGAGGVTRVEGDVAARQGHYESDLSHAAGYVAFDDGVWAADVSASFYGGDLDTRRGITIGAFRGTAIGNTHVEGQALSASVARRFQVTDTAMVALGAIGTASNASVDGYTETGAGGLSLVASGQERDWQTLQLTARATQDYRVNGQAFRIYGGAGVMAMAGDRQATGDMRFSGAPVGFGSFVVEGAEAPPLAGLVDFGLEVGAGEGVTVSAGYRGLFSERLQDNQVGIKLQVSW